MNHSSSYPETDSAFGPGPCGQRDVMREALQVSGSEEGRLTEKKNKQNHYKNQMQSAEVPTIQDEEKLSFSSTAHWKAVKSLSLAWFILQ